MHIADTKAGRVEQVSEISRALKALAKDLQVPVLALAQLNREVEHRTPPRPQLSDLRDSGAIEQDADVVMFITRDDAYFTPEEWERRFPTRRYPEGLATIIVAKHRNGPTGEGQLWFDKRLTRFSELPRLGA